MLPTMKIGDLEVTRLIVGSNPFTGKSHLDKATDDDMKSYFSETLINHGICGMIFSQNTATEFCSEQTRIP